MIIRIANIKDLKDIVDIYNQSIISGNKTGHTRTFDVGQRVDWFNAHSTDRYPILVAAVDHEIRGYLSLSAYREGREAFASTAEISFYVDNNYQGENIGSQLLQQAINLCPELKIKNLVAMLIEGNQVSIGLLEKFGFKKWGHLPDIAEFNENVTGHLYYGLRINDK